MKKRIFTIWMIIVSLFCQSFSVIAEETAEKMTEAPAFDAEIVLGGREGNAVYGIFREFTPEIQEILPMYSLDGKNYLPIQDREWNLPKVTSGGSISVNERDCRQVCLRASDEPFVSYQEGKIEQFYVKLQIGTKKETYDTKPAQIGRGEVQPQPEGTSVIGRYPDGMYKREGRPPVFTFYGKYQVTVREGTTKEELLALLPDTLPVEAQIMKPDDNGGSETFDKGIFQQPVEWTLPEELSLTAEDGTVIIKDAIAPLELQAGQEVRMLTGVYKLNEPPVFDSNFASEEVRLYINVISKEEKADISLSDEHKLGYEFPLTLAFNLKPTGASEINYFYYADGMEEWKKAGNLLEKLPVDNMPKDSAYGMVPLFYKEESPYKEYMAGEIDGFLVGIEIIGGVYDGELYTLEWPGEYDLPFIHPDFVGSGGNEGNAGSGNEGDSSEGGQRPDLPEEEIPPVSEPDTEKPLPPDTGKPPVTVPDGELPPVTIPDIEKPSVPEPEEEIPSVIKPDTQEPLEPDTDGEKLPVIAPDSEEASEPDTGKSPVTAPDGELPPVIIPDTGKPSVPEAEKGISSITEPERKELSVLVADSDSEKRAVSDLKEESSTSIWLPEKEEQREIEEEPEIPVQKMQSEPKKERHTSGKEKKEGLPGKVAALLLGGGIMAVALTGTKAGKSILWKLLKQIIKVFTH